VSQPAFGIAGEVGVFGEYFAGGFEFLQLDELAISAYPGMQRIKAFHGAKLGGF
jgi:hypothetical protein